MSGPMMPCSRCGIKREARRTTALCADCRTVLTKAEQKAWRK